jgi:hypothetical protein
MTTQEAQALREWATSLIGEGGLLRDDFRAIGIALADVRSPSDVSVEGRR